MNKTRRKFPTFSFSATLWAVENFAFIDGGILHDGRISFVEESIRHNALEMKGVTRRTIIQPDQEFHDVFRFPGTNRVVFFNKWAENIILWVIEYFSQIVPAIKKRNKSYQSNCFEASTMCWSTSCIFIRCVLAVLPWNKLILWW